MGKNSKGGGFRSPGAQKAEEKNSKSEKSLGSTNTPPKQLSEKVSSMKFMQRKAAALQTGGGALQPLSSKHSQAIASSGEEGATRVVLLDGEGSPLVRHFPGRRSFNGFNKTIEEYATSQIKEFRRAAREVARGGPEIKVEKKPIDVERVTGKLYRDETKDVSDLEMARAIGKQRREGQGGGGKKQKIGAACEGKEGSSRTSFNYSSGGGPRV